MGSIETILAEAGDDGGFADVLFADEDDFFLFDVPFMCGVADLIFFLVHLNYRI